MKKIILSTLSLLFLAGSSVCAQSDHILWYNQPARYFEESLVLGNGKMGASVFGGVNSDMIFLNDATLWTGEPVNANMNPEAYKNLPAIREALKNEDYKLADSLNRRLQGKYSESYAPLGTLYLNFKHKGAPAKYYRELDIADAVSKVEYEVNGVKFTREYFISYPDKVMVLKLTSSKKGALNFDIRFGSLLKYKVSTLDKKLSAHGHAPLGAKPVYLGDNLHAVTYNENRGTRFSTLARIKNTDGLVSVTDSTLVLSNGTEAVVLVSV
ncbi:MAG: glycoside hydrolase family 95 protein, partial [Bacteroidota bacterium]|nr:glycoside hydrolase family 95 protein [Bacteroidota bacterium]